MEQKEAEIPKHEDTPAIGAFRSAEAFLIAADRHHQWLNENQTIYTLFDQMPVYFLYGLGIELVLKSYLRVHGFTARQLSAKNHYGHDLLNLYQECCRNGLRLPGDYFSTMVFLTRIQTH